MKKSKKCGSANGRKGSGGAKGGAKGGGKGGAYGGGYHKMK